MWSITKKELGQFFSSLTAYLAIIVFLVVMGLYLFVLPETNIFSYGYATLESFFSISPWVLMIIIPAITMRSLSEEIRGGTIETLVTRPLTKWSIVLGKYFSVLVILLLILLPTLFYVYTLQQLSSAAALDTGALLGSYLGLYLLAAVFAAISICCSSFTANAVIAFLLSVVVCLIIYYGFHAISLLPSLQGSADYYIEMLGIDFHYRSISRGVMDTRDLIYFFSLIFFSLMTTTIVLHRR
ncbi:MAG: ABC transporter permease subunit [Ferruginibacter sp.]